jgi:hypothetical protein
MGQTTKATRENRTITVDFHDETTYSELLGNTKAFVEFVLAFILALGFQLLHKASCSQGGCLTRHSHYILPLCPYPLGWGIGKEPCKIPDSSVLTGCDRR